MGMLAELGGKGGGLCEPAKRGELRCPLIVRSTSEDVVTGNIFGVLGAINARWWLSELLNGALGAERFQQRIYRHLKIELWRKQPMFPRSLLPWEEGRTEVDVEITWENPSTTVFIEMKYGSPLSATTVNNNGHGTFAADQLIRNARVGLYKCGWYQEDQLFYCPPRDFVVVLFAPTIGNPIVQKYRDTNHLLRSIPFAEKLLELPNTPFVGETCFSQLIEILRRNNRFMSTAERKLSNQLMRYLELKLDQLGKVPPNPYQDGYG